MLPRLLIADEAGRVFDHPHLAAAMALGAQLAPAEGLVALPESGALQALPGWSPIGYDAETGRYVVVDELVVSGKKIKPRAVGAVLPPGYTRAALPAGRRSPLAPTLPQWAYTAAALLPGRRGAGVAAVRTERRHHWDGDRYSTPDLPARVAARIEVAPRSRVLKQLETCALSYRCFTAQNIFYGRDEGALPASTSCNARCIGCISEQPKGAPPASHVRMDAPPLWEDLAAVGAHHLATAKGHVMVSFGQGCEGEPLTRAAELEQAVRAMRQVTQRGTVHLNTNGSLPGALERLARAGLESVRVSLNSAHAELYEAYYLPQGYTFADVERTLAVARRRKLYVALNLLTFPGVTDREGEIAALIRLVRKHRVDQVQTRPLAIDPLQYLDVAEGRGAGGEPLGLRELLRRLKHAAPWVSIGSFSRARDER